MNPRTPSNQPYYGEVYPSDEVVRRRAFVGQINPTERERLKMQYGRYLSGYEEPTDFGGSIGEDPNYPNPELQTMEMEDDAFGSGIFSGNQVTGNQDTGVFESSYQLPGYVARETPFAVSRDVSSAQGHEMVYIPAGGYISRNPPVLGPTPQPYPLPTLNADAPVQEMPTFGPPRDPQWSVERLPLEMTRSIMPSWPRLTRMPTAFGQDEPKSSPPTAGQMFLWGGVLGAGVGLGALALGFWRKKK